MRSSAGIFSCSIEANKGRLTIIGIAIVATALITFIVNLHGWQKGWEILGIKTQSVSWLDLRTFHAAAQTAAAGGNPYVPNPLDPAGRPFNYPSLWLPLFPKNLAPAELTALALASATLAVCTVLTWTRSFSIHAGVFMALLLASPSLLLAIERSNTDLPMFSLTGLGLIALHSRFRVLSQLGVLGLLLASILKLFPAIGLAVAALAGPPVVRLSARIALVVFIVWSCAHLTETLASLNNTQTGVVHSYGRTILPSALELWFRAHGGRIDPAPIASLANALTAAVVIVLGWLGCKHAGKTTLLGKIAHEEIGWLTGGAIYGATFAIGSSFTYRLWFFLLGIPWLLSRAREADTSARWAQVALGSFFVLLYASAVWWLPLVWVAQAAGWILFACVTFLLATGIASRLRETRLSFSATS